MQQPKRNLNINKAEYTCFKQEGTISTLSGGRLKLVDKFMYLASSAFTTESDYKRPRKDVDSCRLAID